MAFVIDASSMLALAFAEISQDRAEKLLDRLGSEEAVVPAIFPLEVANALEMGRRRNRIEAALVDRFLSEMQKFRMTVEPAVSLTDAKALRAYAERSRLTVYDATYLDLAMRRKLPLISLDNALIRAAQEARAAVESP
jgi:predicted nucleic acid-binding protein